MPLLVSFGGISNAANLHHYNVKLLLRIKRLNLDFNLFTDEDFHFCQRMRLITFQCFPNGGRGLDQEAIGIVGVMNTDDLAHDFITDRFDRFQCTPPFTYRAVLAKNVFNAFTGTLAGHLN